MKQSDPVGPTGPSKMLRQLSTPLYPLLFALLLTPVATASADAEAPPDINLARAAALHEEARALRSLAESDFATTEPACYQRFLVNRCLDQARQLRLERIREARALEIEAHKIELADKQRRAEQEGLTEQVIERDREIPAQTVIPPMSPDARVEEIRSRRDAEARTAEAQAAEERARRDAERERSREREAAAASRRAEQAARDRERYDERIRRREDAR
ncbi:hypothetical protein ACKVEX_13835 [Rhodocyclaceae bacterium SMB388]